VRGRVWGMGDFEAIFTPQVTFEVRAAHLKPAQTLASITGDYPV
jgi:hypothetical protein